MTIPVGVGYYQEFGGNITGDFHRAVEPIPVTDIQDFPNRPGHVLFRLPNGKRGTTRKDLLVA